MHLGPNQINIVGHCDTCENLVRNHLESEPMKPNFFALYGVRHTESWECSAQIFRWTNEGLVRQAIAIGPSNVASMDWAIAWQPGIYAHGAGGGDHPYGSTCPAVVWWVPWSESTSWGWSHHLWRHAPTTVFALCCMQIVLLTRSPGRFALSFLTAEFSTFWNLPTTNYSLNKTQFMKILRQKINSHRPASGLKSKTKRKMKMPKRMPLRMAKLLLINQMLTAWMRMMQISLPQIQICLQISNTSSRGLWGNPSRGLLVKDLMIMFEAGSIYGKRAGFHKALMITAPCRQTLFPQPCSPVEVALCLEPQTHTCHSLYFLDLKLRLI